MPKFRKKPVEVEAIQSTGTPESNRGIIDWTRGSETSAYMDEHTQRGHCLSINTLEGAMWVDKGDWIIKGVNGEFYPCKPDIFEKTYEAADTPVVTITKAELDKLRAIEEAAKGICNPCESCLKPCKSSHQCAWRSAFIKLQALLSSPAAPEPEQPSTETCPMCAAFHDDCFGAVGTSKCTNPERYKEPEPEWPKYFDSITHIHELHEDGRMRSFSKHRKEWIWDGQQDWKLDHFETPSRQLTPSEVRAMGVPV
jgi:hypothetical protein